MSSSSNLNSNIRIYSRVRTPLQHEIYASNSSTGSVSDKKLKTQSSKQSITYPKQSSLFSDYSYSFYSPEIENNQRIVYLKNPVKGKLLEKSFKIENESRPIQSLIPEVSGVFELDKCFAQNFSNTKIYNQTCKKILIDALNGKSGTVIAMGPTSGGKSHLLRGDETKEKGLTLQYIEDLFDANEISRESGGHIYNFKCSIYGIYQNNIVDFLSPKFKDNLQLSDDSGSNDEENIFSDREMHLIVEEKIHSVGDFKHLYRKSMNNLKLYSNQYKNNDFKNDCHIIVSVINEKQNALPRETRACVNFVRLASTDNLVERKSVREDLKILLRHLLHCSTAIHTNETSNIHNRSRLTQCLVSAMNEISNIALFICISPAARSSEGSIYAIEFAYAIFQEVIANKNSVIKQKSPMRSTQKPEHEIERSRSIQIPHHPSFSETVPARLARKRSSSTDDFNSLYEIYNKTKESIKKHDNSIKIEDHSTRKKTTEGSEEDDSLFGIEGEMTNIKKEIYAKIDEVIEESLNPPLPEDPTTERLYNETLNAKRNLKQIKKSIEHKEMLEREAMKTLRDKEKRAKDKIRTYRQRMRELEDLLAEKDTHIERLEDTIRESKNHLKNSEKKLVNLFEKEEELQKNEDGLHEMIDKLKRKLITSKEKYRGRLNAYKDKLLEVNERLGVLETENGNLKSILDDTKSRSFDILNALIVRAKEHTTLKSVQEDLSNYREEFEKQEKIIGIMKDNNNMQDRMIEDLKAKVIELTKDNEKLLYDRENLNNLINKEREKGENVYDSLKKLQNQSLKLEQRNNELEKEILHLKRDREGSKKLQDDEVGRLYQQLTIIKKELDQTKYDNEDLIKRNQTEEVKRDKQVREFQAELKVLYQNVNDERRRNKELIEENTRLVEQHKQKLNLLDKYERQLDRLGSEQGHQMEALHNKCEELFREAQELKRDNTNLRETEVALLRKLDAAETARQELHAKCADYKADNRVLKENLREIDEKMKKLLYQNNVDLKVLNLGTKMELRRNLDTDPDF